MAAATIFNETLDLIVEKYYSTSESEADMIEQVRSGMQKQFTSAQDCETDNKPRFPGDCASLHFWPCPSQMKYYVEVFRNLDKLGNVTLKLFSLFYLHHSNNDELYTAFVRAGGLESLQPLWMHENAHTRCYANSLFGRAFQLPSYRAMFSDDGTPTTVDKGLLSTYARGALACLPAIEKVLDEGYDVYPNSQENAVICVQGCLDLLSQFSLSGDHIVLPSTLKRALSRIPNELSEQLMERKHVECEDSVQCLKQQILLEESPATPEYDDALFLAAHFKILGNRAFKYKRYANAVAIYEESLTRIPDAKVYGNKALAEMNDGKATEACVSAARAVELDPSSSKAWYLSAKAQHMAGNADAAKAIEHARKLDPDDGLVRNLSLEINRALGS